MIAGIVPASGLKSAKTRLSHPWLSRSEKLKLVMAMFESAVTSMAGSRLDATYVVSSDPVLLARSAQLGAEPVPEPGKLGIDGAVALATRRAVLEGATAALVLFSDVPLVTIGDVDRLVERAVGLNRCVMATRSKRGGTNALWRMPAEVISTRYGENSFIKHRSEAVAAGVPFFEFRCARMSLDIDTLDDVLLLVRKDRRAGRYAFLSRLLEKQGIDDGG